MVETKRQTSESSFKTPPGSPTPSMQNLSSPVSPKLPQDVSPPKKSISKEKVAVSYVIECVAVCKAASLTLLDESSDYTRVHELLRVSGKIT